MNKVIRIAVLVALALSSLSSVRTACAQESRASLGGKVTDPQQAVVSGAIVTVTSSETGVVQATTTNSSGEWRVRYLIPGHYSFDVKAKGFKGASHDLIELQVGDQKTADAQLQIGSVTESVDVSAEFSPLIDTTAAVSGTVITTKELEDLPTQSHVATLLIGLTPGGLVGNGYGGQPHLWSNIGDSQVQVNGTGSVAGSGAQNNNYSVQYTLDGSYDSTNSGQIAFVPPQDSIAEFRVQTNAYDASIGRQSGGTLNIVSKTGTKSFHGSLFEYNQNNSLNAYVWNGTKTAIHYNEYGGTVGGPVWIPHLYDGRNKKTFFFFSYDGIRNNAPVNTGYMTLPSMLERGGDFSQSFQRTSGVQYPITVYDPSTVDANGNRTVFTGKVPVSQFAQAIFALMPQPDTPPDTTVSSDSNNYKKKEVQRDKMSTYAVRADQAWNNSNHSYANVSFNNWNEISYNPFGGFANDILNSLWQTRRQRIVTLDHNVVISPTLLLDMKYNVLSSFGSSYSGSAGYNDSALGLSSGYIGQMTLQSIPLITGVANGAENGGLGTNQGASYTSDTFQTIDGSLTQTFRNHAFKYGFEHMIQQEGTGGLGQSGGSFSFGSATNTSSNSWTCQNPVKNCTSSVGNGSNVAQFLLGLPVSGSIPVNATAFWSQHYTAAYFQDDWRVTSKLTIDLGLRWDFQTGVSERHNKSFARYDPNYVQTAVTTPSQASYAALIGSSSTNVGVNLLQAYGMTASNFQAKGAIEFAGVHGTRNTVYDPRYRYFMPRIGVAYRIHPNTVIRGGLGRFTQANFNTASQTGFSATTNYTATSDNYYHQYTNPTTGHISTLANPYPDGLTAPTGNSLAEQTNIGSVTGFTDPHYGRVYVDEASASLQQQIQKFLFEIGGTYSRTRGLELAMPTNAIPTNAYLAAFGPQFDSTGRPLDTLSGNTPVTNPFKGVAGIPTTYSQYTSSTVNASQLLRPNPLVNSDINVTTTGGKATYYALLTKVERRYSNGFSLLQAFTWGRNFTQDFYLGNTSITRYIPRQIYSNDIRFHYTLTPMYELPFGKGKRFLKNSNRATEQLVGGWEFTGIYNFQSGTPIVLPTNSTFYRGDKSPNTGLTRGRKGTYFDTSAFVPYPSKSTTLATIQAYPAWTGVSSMPGYSWVPSATDSAKNGIYNDFTVRNTLYPQTFGDIRQPPVNTITAGVRKNFNFTDNVRFQIRFDATNLFNHPQFGGVGVDATNANFGKLSGAAVPTAVNNPRQIEIAGKFFF